jgi:precorrin-6B C5,15-methyltransferase / cobalt-precorrin-6B C5,C15-methyltransferase
MTTNDQYSTIEKFQQKWLSVVGIGEDGLAGLSLSARSLLDRAEIIVGGDRHLAMLLESDRREKLTWTNPIEASIAEIIQRRGQSICVLASGDPMCFGIGVTLSRRIPISEMTIIPSPSAFSLACARLGWSLTDVEMLSLCGRDPAFLNAFLYPHARLLILSGGKQTPAEVAQILVAKGYSQSEITVLEHLGGEKERIVKSIAATWNVAEIADLNAIAVTCIADSDTISLSRFPGLSDRAYHHDGQLTKKEVRAITLAALAPLPGQLLWDVGAGCGSIGIEWMRSHTRCRAIAIEQNPQRLQYIADNASALGVPNLKIVAGEAPTSLKDLPQPDTIFIGGGLTTPNLLETCWDALPVKGLLLANTVTVESEQKLLQWQGKLGGELTRIAISRAEPVGKFLGWKAMAPVTQWVVIK